VVLVLDKMENKDLLHIWSELLLSVLSAPTRMPNAVDLIVVIATVRLESACAKTDGLVVPVLDTVAKMDLLLIKLANLLQSLRQSLLPQRLTPEQLCVLFALTRRPNVVDLLVVIAIAKPVCACAKTDGLVVPVPIVVERSELPLMVFQLLLELPSNVLFALTKRKSVVVLIVVNVTQLLVSVPAKPLGPVVLSLTVTERPVLQLTTNPLLL